MSLDLFSTRKMLTALEQRKPPRTFFLSTFFRGAPNVSDTQYIDIDIWKGKRRLAPFINPRLEGKAIEKIGFKTYTYEPPYIKPKMVTTAEDLLNRPMGANIYAGNATSGVRAAMEVGKNLAELEDMIIRREEWMAAQILTTGKVVVVGDGVDDEIDFLYEATHLPTLLSTAKWDAPTTALPINDLRTWKRLISQDSGVVPTDVIMGSTALELFLACDQIIGSTGGRRGLFDLLRVNMGQIDPTSLENGVTYYGRLTELGLDVWTYDEWYVDEFDNDAERAMMPVTKVLMGSRNARAEMNYGAIRDVRAMASVPRYPTSWVTDDPAARFVMIQSAPLPCLHQVDAFLCATVA